VAPRADYATSRARVEVPVPTIRLNGLEREVPKDATVQGLLELLATEGLTIDPRALAVEVNRSIVPKSAYATHRLADRDEVEIVTIVGGG